MSYVRYPLVIPKEIKERMNNTHVATIDTIINTTTNKYLLISAFRTFRNELKMQPWNVMASLIGRRSSYEFYLAIQRYLEALITYNIIGVITFVAIM